MNKEIKRLFAAAIEDKDFLSEVYAADGDTPEECVIPERVIGFALIYYGWCVGNGKWETIKASIKK